MHTHLSQGTSDTEKGASCFSVFSRNISSLHFGPAMINVLLLCLHLTRLFLA